ncbi:MAG: DUF1499 domain-containing protein [Natronospirillum sp.]|uniref:DUF1499 domain-containing protein n=1 Tax=Salinispirillum sp. LH 10-3-1 TaxID=2952525 RepID=A0AB38YEW1_9GAMM
MQMLWFIPLALIALAFIAIYTQNARVPALGHDHGQLKPLSKDPNGVSTQTDDPAKRVQPWPFKGDRSSTMQAIRNAVELYGNAEVQTQQDDYLYVVFVTKLMRYRDDAEFYLDDKTQQVHFRSKSRAGKSDLGLNAKRFARLTELYQQADVNAAQ